MTQTYASKTAAKKSIWTFGTREVVFAAIGAALYGVLSYATNFLQIPGAGNVSVRPAVSLVFFFGLAFGPWVGFFTGFVGNLLSDLLSGYGLWLWWDLGNGIMGLLPGLLVASMTNFRSLADLLKAEVAVVVAAAVGMFVAAVSELWVSGASWQAVVVGNFLPAFITNIVNGLILVPVLMVAYSAIVSRSGR